MDFTSQPVNKTFQVFIAVINFNIFNNDDNSMMLFVSH